MTGRQVGDERARYGRKSVGERLDDLWDTLARYRLWLVGAAVVMAIGAWFAVMSRNVTVDRLAVGDCLYIPTTAADDPTTTAPIGVERDVEAALFGGGAEAAGCSSSHGHEVSALIPLATAATTQADARTAVQATCDAAFAAFVAHGIAGSQFATFAAVPTPDQWDSGERTAVCLVARADGQWMTTPARGSGD